MHSSPRCRRCKSSRERGIMWLTLINSPVSGSGIKDVPASLCCRSNTSASARAAPRNEGWSAGDEILSLPTQISRLSTSPSKNCSPARAGIRSSQLLSFLAFELHTSRNGVCCAIAENDHVCGAAHDRYNPPSSQHTSHACSGETTLQLKDVYYRVAPQQIS